MNKKELKFFIIVSGLMKSYVHVPG